MEEHYTAYPDYQYLYWRLPHCNVSPTSMQADLLGSQSLFIIDEASMIPTPTHALHAINRCLQDVTGVAVPFGGKVFLLGLRRFRTGAPGDSSCIAGGYN